MAVERRSTLQRETYEQHMSFINETVARLEANQVGIDELEGLARQFAESRQYCLERLSSIEGVLSATLGGEQGGNG
jgi:exonuclease VII small subunit